MRGWKTMLAAAILVAAGSARAQEDAGARGLEPLRFMTGCWEGNTDHGKIEECYSSTANLMTGTTRWFRDGVVTSFEFTLVASEGDRVVLTPFPDGVRSEHGFRLESADRSRAVFVAPEHDFPKRIIYAAPAPDSLVARIDGGEGVDEAREWRMRRIECGPGSAANAAAPASAYP